MESLSGKDWPTSNVSSTKNAVQPLAGFGTRATYVFPSAGSNRDFVYAGPMVDGPVPVWPGSVAVKDADAGRRAVRDLKDRGAQFIKVYERLPRDAYFLFAAVKIRGCHGGPGRAIALY